VRYLIHHEIGGWGMRVLRVLGVSHASNLIAVDFDLESMVCSTSTSFDNLERLRRVLHLKTCIPCRAECPHLAQTMKPSSKSTSMSLGSIRDHL
jgi:hypothetical protein